MYKRQPQIRWTRSDYAKLSSAVRQYNAKLGSLGDKSFLPDPTNYQYEKSRIHTRQQLNRRINDLRSFLQEGAEELYITPTGEQITKWENKMNEKSLKIAERTLNRQMKELEERYDNPYSKAEMGSYDYRETVAQLESIKNYQTKIGEDYKRVKRRLRDIGSYDYEMAKAIIYKENFMYAFTNYISGFEGSKLLKDKLDSIKNPIDFFNYITKNSEILADLFLWYKESAEYIYSGFSSNEEAFKQALIDVGIIEEEKNKLVNLLIKQDYDYSGELVIQAQSIQDYDELKLFYNKYLGRNLE